MENSKEVRLLLEKSGVRFPSHLPYPAFYNHGSVGIINGFYMYHKNYYFVLNGKFPFTDAMKIYDTVNKDWEIRATGNGNNISPAGYETCDEWEIRAKAFMDSTSVILGAGIEKQLTELKEEIFSKNPETYIETYHIDTIDGLLYMVDYIRNNNLVTVW